MRFLFSPPADQATGLLSLPWTEPLAEWQDERIVEVRQRGLHRHVVRFVSEAGHVYVLKELPEPLARREYTLLRELADKGIPVVDVLGVAIDRPGDLDAILVTQFLDYATTYRSLFANPRGTLPTDHLLDAMVQLLARLHLAGFHWGDCSLSNTLFRFDAGNLAAYLVDAETGEMHAALSDRLRNYDVEIAHERIAGELLDLEAGELLPSAVDPIDTADEVVRRYEALWAELTSEDVLDPAEQRYKIAERLARLNELGFDVDEMELVAVPGGNRLKLRTRVAEPGHYRRLLAQRTGLHVQENQARRLLNDMAGFRAYLEQTTGAPVPEPVAANRWLAEAYDPIVQAIPDELRDKLDEAEVFHEVLEHRWFLSEKAGRDVGTTAAARDYLKRVLPQVPDALTQTIDPQAIGADPRDADAIDEML
jgi:tRNA A-37 threonylcarbamoyl transferase component Bud32